MIAERCLNPSALNHLPCSECGKSAKEINRVWDGELPGGTVTYKFHGKNVTSIFSRMCEMCARAKRERGQ